MVKLLLKLFTNSTNVESEPLTNIANMWISGKPYIRIYNTLIGQDIAIKLNQVKKLCSSVLSYHLGFLVGNVLDAIADQSEDLTESVYGTLTATPTPPMLKL